MGIPKILYASCGAQSNQSRKRNLGPCLTWSYNNMTKRSLGAVVCRSLEVLAFVVAYLWFMSASVDRFKALSAGITFIVCSVHTCAAIALYACVKRRLLKMLEDELGVQQ